MTGGECEIQPYTSQRNTPKVKSPYIESDRLRVSRVFRTLTIWGRKDRVVKAPARKPIKLAGSTIWKEGMGDSFKRIRNFFMEGRQTG